MVRLRVKAFLFPCRCFGKPCRVSQAPGLRVFGVSGNAGRIQNVDPLKRGSYKASQIVVQ